VDELKSFSASSGAAGGSAGSAGGLAGLMTQVAGIAEQINNTDAADNFARLTVRNSSLTALLASLLAPEPLLVATLLQLNDSSAALEESESVAEVKGELGPLRQEVWAQLTPTFVKATPGDGQAAVRWALANATVTAEPGAQQCSSSGL